MDVDLSQSGEAPPESPVGGELEAKLAAAEEEIRVLQETAAHVREEAKNKTQLVVQKAKDSILKLQEGNQQKIEDLEAQHAQAQAEVDASFRAEVEALKAQIAENDVEISGLKAEITRLREESQGPDPEFESMQARNLELEAALDQKDGKLQKTLDLLAQKTQELSEVASQLNEVQAGHQAQADALAFEEIARLKGENTELTQRCQEFVGLSADEFRQTAQDLETLKAQETKLQADLQETEALRQKAEEQLEEKTREVSQLTSRLAQAEAHHSAGSDELGRISQDFDQLKTHLDEALTQNDLNRITIESLTGQNKLLTDLETQLRQEIQDIIQGQQTEREDLEKAIEAREQAWFNQRIEIEQANLRVAEEDLERLRQVNAHLKDSLAAQSIPVLGEAHQDMGQD